MSNTPKELIEDSLAEIAARVTLAEETSPASHTVVVASGLDDPEVAAALARYAVAFLAGWVQRDASIGARMGVQGVENREEIRRVVERIVQCPAGLDAEQQTNWRRTWRNGWIAEVVTHALFVIRRSTASPFLDGDVLALLRPHAVPKRQGLDSVAIYDDDSVAVLAVGETKASCERGSEELTHACDMFDQVDAGSFGPELRDAIDLLADVLPAHLLDQVSDSLWRDQRCYLPAILHETPFDASSPRARLARLQPPAERKRVLVLRLQAFDAFFDAVAAAMPETIDELVV
ncbi:MAG: hypothetical protein ACLQMH_08470 [Solirubrobacteraceae bacterium]